MTSLHRAKAQLFADFHGNGEVLALANVWDVASARLVEQAGGRAVATTSAGVAWSLGAPDGDRLARDRALDLIRRVVAAVDVPVSADIEGGFGASADEVADTVRAVLAAGAVGINIEDAAYGGAGPLRDPDDQAERIAAARRAADDADVPLFVNARIDTYLRAVGAPTDRLADTLTRARTYLAAGASGIFAPGVLDRKTITELVAGIPAPLNILAGPGAPNVRELASWGVARVSVGSSMAQAAYGIVRRATERLLRAGEYTDMVDGVDYGELNTLLNDTKPIQ